MMIQKYKTIDGLPTTEYGFTFVRKCSYCTKIIHPSPYREKGRFRDKNTLLLKKVQRGKIDTYCSDECRQLHMDEKTVATYIKDKQRQRLNYYNKKNKK